MHPTPAAAPPLGPWFQRRPRLALVVAAALFVGVLGLRLLAGPDSGEAITMLFVLPVSLVALTRGLRGGLVAGCVAVGLTAAWVLLSGADLSPLGWASRVVPHLLVGALLGDAADRLAGAEAERRAHAEAEQRHRQAIEINDSLVQGMAAAKWTLEAGRHEVGLQRLGETLAEGQRLVSDLLREADRASGRRSRGR